MRMTTQTTIVFHGLRDVRRARPAVENELKTFFPSNYCLELPEIFDSAQSPQTASIRGSGIVSKMVARFQTHESALQSPSHLRERDPAVQPSPSLPGRSRFSLVSCRCPRGAEQWFRPESDVPFYTVDTDTAPTLHRRNCNVNRYRLIRSCPVTNDCGLRLSLSARLETQTFRYKQAPKHMPNSWESRHLS
jgi:hypothetical protein